MYEFYSQPAGKNTRLHLYSAWEPDENLFAIYTTYVRGGDIRTNFFGTVDHLRHIVLKSRKHTNLYVTRQITLISFLNRKQRFIIQLTQDAWSYIKQYAYFGPQGPAHNPVHQHLAMYHSTFGDWSSISLWDSHFYFFIFLSINSTTNN